MNQSEQIQELVKALIAAQEEIKPVKKNAKNPFFKSEYAELSEVMRACQGPLGKHGLAIIQTVEDKDPEPVLVTTLVHTSGQWIRSIYPLMVGKKDSQSLGSAITYARRYAVQALIGICPVDDDGEAAMELTPAAIDAIKKEVLTNEKSASMWRKKFNVYDLTTINRAQYMEMMKFNNAQKIKRENDNASNVA